MRRLTCHPVARFASVTSYPALPTEVPTATHDAGLTQVTACNWRGELRRFGECAAC
jgi:hypothetical protein